MIRATDKGAVLKPAKVVKKTRTAPPSKKAVVPAALSVVDAVEPVSRGRGRPPGPPVRMLSLGLAPDLVKKIDAAWVKGGYATRTATIAALLEKGLAK